MALKQTNFEAISSGLRQPSNLRQMSSVLSFLGCELGMNLPSSWYTGREASVSQIAGTQVVPNSGILMSVKDP